MKLIERATRYRPSEGAWLVITLVLLGLIVALPAAAWSQLDAAAFGYSFANR